MNLAAKEKKEVVDGGSMADIFECLLWDRQFVELVSLNLPKIPVIAQCEEENKSSHKPAVWRGPLV